MCLARFSRFVARVHPAPAGGSDPEGYLAAALDVIARRSIDVLFARSRTGLSLRRRLPATLGVALSDLAAFEQVQSKTALMTLLRALDVPQPATEIVRSLAAAGPLPFFVKTAFGTASKGVWRIGDAASRDALARELEAAKAFGAGVVMQQPAIGPLERSQAVFDHGRLVAFHVYRQIAEGPGGGDVRGAFLRSYPRFRNEFAAGLRRQPAACRTDERVAQRRRSHRRASERFARRGAAGSARRAKGS